jgi:hypothetical protein
MLELALAVLIVFAALAGWIVVQHAARRYAARHPELGPAREEGEGCGGCGCAGGSCRRDTTVTED